MWPVDPSQFLAAILLDLLMGDPRSWPHIARLTGGLAIRYEAVLTAKNERSVTLGMVFWGLVAGTMFAGYLIAYFLCHTLGWAAVWFLNTFIIYQSIAATDLHRHVQAVFGPLAAGNLGKLAGVFRGLSVVTPKGSVQQKSAGRQLRAWPKALPMPSWPRSFGAPSPVLPEH